ncbi:MAG: hypothetical protein ACI4JC_00255 [Faecalibacterium sp.]
MDASKTMQSRAHQPEARQPQNAVRQTMAMPEQAAAMLRLRAALTRPELLFTLPPEHLRLLASQIGNSAMEQFLGSGSQPGLEAGPSAPQPWPELEPNEITAPEPMLCGGPEALAPISTLPPPSPCRILED